jgi:dTDP-4-amino-4,6-dideoxygalactose transaminase
MHREKHRIPFNKPFIVGKELHNIAQTVVAHAHLSGDGPFTRRCQRWLEDRLGCARALLTHSCTGALELAAILCDIEPGNEVIMPSFTFVSTANAFVLRGGVPVFVDIKQDTLNIDETLIEQAITPRTKVIVPVHYAGIACAMNEIMHIATQHGLLVVEDAAQAMLSSYNGKYLGNLGHLGCLSFHETKNVISGEGGALLINDEKLVERAEIIWEKGTNRAGRENYEVQISKFCTIPPTASTLGG